MGRPGPALTIGVPLLILGAAGYFGYTTFVKPSLEEKQETATNKTLAESTSIKKFGETIKVAGDPWSGYSTFRSEPRLAQRLAKEDIGIEYIDDEKLYDQNERMKALASGKIDVALTTVDAFLQHGQKHKDSGGLYPGVILWGIDESNGGDAIFLAKGKSSFDDVSSSSKVCYAEGTPSEHLWDFASLSFQSLGDNPVSPGVVAEDCWKKLQSGEVEIAVLWQPFTAVAEQQGYPKVFATGGQADDVIVDVLVANREYAIKHQETLQKLASAYFKVIDSYDKDPAAHGKFITADCGQDCSGDTKLGESVLGGIDFLTYNENACLWFGHCGTPAKLTGRIAKTSRLLVAKGKLQAAEVPKPETIINDRFLTGIKRQLSEQAKLAAEVAGKDTEVKAPEIKASEKKFTYDAESTKDQETAIVGTLRLPPVYFQHGSAQLDPNAKSVVSGIADQLTSFPALCVHVWGHTNSRGSKATNKELSLRRAMSIVAALQETNTSAFPKSRFDVRGFGSERPILNDGKEDLDASRRTEFKLFNCAG